jgi:5-formyltetrahydrofolate cyclo-ligase
MASPPTRPNGQAAEPPEPDDRAYGAYSSPPCLMHELGPDFLGSMPDRDPPPGSRPQGAVGKRPAIRRWRTSVLAGPVSRRLRLSARRGPSQAR